MKTFVAIAILSLAASTPTLVNAHGFIRQVAIDGRRYAGNLHNSDKGASPIRLVGGIGPVKGTNSKDLICGLSAQNAEMVVPANPGSTVSFQWSGGGNQRWPHSTGPLITYMTSCGPTSCDKFDPTNAKWFKIAQLGKKDANTWFQEDIERGSALNVTLPKNLSPGGYLIRQEIIALHHATSMGGAEFYPSCIQVQIGGCETGFPLQTVSFPGAYSDSDPGIFDPDVHSPGSFYNFPGGPVSELAAASNSGAVSEQLTDSATSPSPSSSLSADDDAYGYNDGDGSDDNTSSAPASDTSQDNVPLVLHIVLAAVNAFLLVGHSFLDRSRRRAKRKSCRCGDAEQESQFELEYILSA
ncbi:hypothetical protein EIP91_008683 [Steccherinum ochraceum]|uniref:lytic cellulose monooxygenase (C4-dehydrogenating) n=1 Tax=Steccherinum ochraceum TaxID=92696 RepID=A0A4V2MV67_9APHY|nr:hypothetical protein EIP91_008683 [Steccherinum ochraceum]